MNSNFCSTSCIVSCSVLSSSMYNRPTSPLIDSHSWYLSARRERLEDVPWASAWGLELDDMARQASRTGQVRNIKRLRSNGHAYCEGTSKILKEDMYEGCLFIFYILRRQKPVSCARSGEDTGSEPLAGDKSANLKSRVCSRIQTPCTSRQAALGILLRF